MVGTADWRSVMHRAGVLVLLTTLASGCGQNLLGGNLYTSNVFFLPPGAATTVYVETRNTSDNQAVSLNDVASRLSAKGYQIVTDPSQAGYVIQANIVYCNTEKQLITMETMVAGGYGGGIGGTIGAIGGAIGTIGGVAGMANPAIGMGAAGVSAVTGAVGGAISSVSGLFGSNRPKSKEETTYACVTDLQITERASAGPRATAGRPQVYRTRLVAGIHQKKLDLQEATPLIQHKLSTGVAGNF